MNISQPKLTSDKIEDNKNNNNNNEVLSTKVKVQKIQHGKVMVEKEVADAATIPQICSSVLLMYFHFGIDCT